MTSGKKPAELDILAWADGQLDRDPGHRRAVELALARDPSARARAEAYRAQTLALRKAYGGRLEEPVPDRLAAVLDRPAPLVAQPVARAAAVLLATLVAGSAGWLLGRGGEPPISTDARAAALLSDRGYAQFVSEQPGRAGPDLAAVVGAAQPLDWLADEVSITLKAPDLALAGYSLQGKQAVTVDGQGLVRLDYAGPEARSFSLFLAPRWEEEGQAIVESRRGGVSIASWSEGPLISAVVARMPAGEVRRLAQQVRRSMRAGGQAPGLIEPVPALPPAGQPGVVADTLTGPAADGLPSPAAGSPVTIRPN